MSIYLWQLQLYKSSECLYICGSSSCTNPLNGYIFVVALALYKSSAWLHICGSFSSVQILCMTTYLWQLYKSSECLLHIWCSSTNHLNVYIIVAALQILPISIYLWQLQLYKSSEWLYICGSSSSKNHLNVYIFVVALAVQIL